MLAAGVLLVGHVVLQHTRFGRYVYMTGGNREAARLAGVRTHRIVIGLPGHLRVHRWAGRSDQLPDA